MTLAIRRKLDVIEAPDPASDDVALSSIFGALDFTSTAQGFRGGSLSCLNGGGILDLRGATLAPGGATLSAAITPIPMAGSEDGVLVVRAEVLLAHTRFRYPGDGLVAISDTGSNVYLRPPRTPGTGWGGRCEQSGDRTAGMRRCVG